MFLEIHLRHSFFHVACAKSLCHHPAGWSPQGLLLVLCRGIADAIHTGRACFVMLVKYKVPAMDLVLDETKNTIDKSPVLTTFHSRV